MYNAGQYVGEAIESVLKQSFSDFEFIIIDDGSEDNSLSVIESFKDGRIIIIRNRHDFITSLNSGWNAAKGKYIARMNADDIMHIDRLKVQQSVMEEDPEITVCGGYISFFSEKMASRVMGSGFVGIIDYPMIELLKKCFIPDPTTMIRKDFIDRHSIRYRHDYVYAEDYRLWFDISRYGGLFYVEPQILLFYRFSKSQLTYRKKDEQEETASRVKADVLEYLVSKYGEKYPDMIKLSESLYSLKEQKLFADSFIFDVFYGIFKGNRGKVKL